MIRPQRPLRSVPRILLLGMGCASPPPEPAIVLNHVTLVDVRAGTTTPDQMVVMRGRRIAAIGDAGTTPIPDDARVVVDGQGRYLIPGLWDMHVHLSGEEAALPVLVGYGITGVRDMGGDVAELAREMASPRLVFAGPMLRGPHAPTDSGPWVIRTAVEGTRAVDSLVALHVEFIEVHEDLARAPFFRIAREARAKDIPFASGTWLDPTIGGFRTFAPRQWPAIFAEFRDLVPLLRARHVGLLAGTDLGTKGIVPGQSLHDELALLVDAGFTAAEALRAATLNPAHFLGLADSLGTVEAGKLADLVLLERDPLTDIRNTRAIVAVVREGQVWRPNR